ncbi:hypothetical protein DYB28_014636 [Aphanomyces astaci]|uniref:Uncharacterized protein n=1 Tax=Aphanomyces astaci TaxID=112090 RepID=A0A9X8DRF6_APHAT|nr:hypothetical protein DYB28_014636 [Aphanomyces astaci]
MQRATIQTLAKAVKTQAPAQVRLLSYTERQARLGRPVSPHVEIYAFPITALSSITNRVTGTALSGGFAAVGALSVIGADVPSLIYSAQEIIPFFAPIWDNNPDLLSPPQAAPTSYALFGGAAVLSLGAAAITIKRE